MNRTFMVIIAHADDAAGMCGGTLIKLAAEGWRVIVVRVTNDDKDSHALPNKTETERANTVEFQHAAEILGVSEVVELGFVTDVLGDVSMVALRESIVYNFRKYRPYAVMTFDPYAMYEPNLDHRRVAQAVEEATWVSNFHLHYPEHIKEGYRPHSVCERWYFARVPVDPNHAVDITPYIERKIEALVAHDKMIRNTLHQLLLQLKTWGRCVPQLNAALDGDIRPLVSDFVYANARHVAKQYGPDPDGYAEVFRVNRFGAWEAFVQAHSQPLPGEPDDLRNLPPFEPDRGPRLFN
jgi:LmbE family N-acetylglucosaminyl deacetylase